MYCFLNMIYFDLNAMKYMKYSFSKSSLPVQHTFIIINKAELCVVIPNCSLCCGNC